VASGRRTRAEQRLTSIRWHGVCTGRSNAGWRRSANVCDPG